MSQWSSSDDKNFNLQEFYNTIVVMFEKDPQHPWVVETLEWWNEYLHYFIYLEITYVLQTSTGSSARAIKAEEAESVKCEGPNLTKSP